MNSAIEFHDSEVAAVEPSAGALDIRFSAAYVHRSEGEPGRDPGAGYLQAVHLRFEHTVWSGEPADCVGKLSDGDLFLDDVNIGLVPLPYAAEGRVRFRLNFANGAELAVEALSVALAQAGEARFVENFKC